MNVSVDNKESVTSVKLHLWVSTLPSRYLTIKIRSGQVIAQVIRHKPLRPPAREQQRLLSSQPPSRSSSSLPRRTSTPYTTHPLSSACNKKTSIPSSPTVPYPPPSSLTPTLAPCLAFSPAPTSSTVAHICRRICTVHALIQFSKAWAVQLEGAGLSLIYISSIVSVRHFFYTTSEVITKGPVVHIVIIMC